MSRLYFSWSLAGFPMTSFTLCPHKLYSGGVCPAVCLSLYGLQTDWIKICSLFLTHRALWCTCLQIKSDSVVLMIKVSDYMGYVQVGTVIDLIALFKRKQLRWMDGEHFTLSQHPNSALCFYNSWVKLSAHTETCCLEDGETLNWRTGQSCQHLL